MFDINPKDLRKKLIVIYSDYSSDDSKFNDGAVLAAEDADGLWSGAFMLDKDLESAIGGLIWLYTEPRMSKDKARIVLETLRRAENSYK